MSDKAPKTRRRFLADLLFLGGGLTAASLVAGTVLQETSSTVVEPELSSAEPPETVATSLPRRATPGFDPTDDGVIKSQPLRHQMTGRDPFSKKGEEPAPLVLGNRRAHEKTYETKPLDYVNGGMTLPSAE